MSEAEREHEREQRRWAWERRNKIGLVRTAAEAENRREAADLRARACSRCMATHPGEC